MNLESNGEISNEFFKKLNQQVVQKDNLIKLLQLQIKNLKGQIESGSADSEELNELKQALQNKTAEAEALSAELASQKEQFFELDKQKEEQIKSLSQMLQSSAEAAEQSDGGEQIKELEAKIRDLEEKALSYSQAELQVNELNQEIASLKAELADESSSASAEAKAEAEALKEQLNQIKAELTEAAKNAEDERNQYLTKNQELEQDAANLKNLLSQKEQELANALNQATPEEIADLKTQIAALQATPAQNAELEDLQNQLNTLQQQNEALNTAAAKAAELEAEKTALNTQIEKLNSQIEAERQEHNLQIETIKKEAENEKTLKSSAANEEVEQYKAELNAQKEALAQRENEISRLRVALEARQDQSINDPAAFEEVEQLTRQVADQLLAIQGFENVLNNNKRQLEEKDAEIKSLNSKITALTSASASEAGDDNNKIIVSDGENDIISSFIDFFDGLDSVIDKNPIPQLQALHKKLLDRLIIPNKIEYMPVIAEQYDPRLHYATDYFRSNKFPEKCIVFEVEKGYKKNDAVIKKAKVWLVQNLYNCPNCGATQSNVESRFCHLCGAKIVAPNGLALDSIPEFEPTPITYQRFAESMVKRKDYKKAAEYLNDALKLDNSFVPSLISLAQIKAEELNYEAALELLKKADSIKSDDSVKAKITDLVYNYFEHAKTLDLPPQELYKLLRLIEKQDE